jgi:hypothetical protein
MTSFINGERVMLNYDYNSSMERMDAAVGPPTLEERPSTIGTE